MQQFLLEWLGPNVAYDSGPGGRITPVFFRCFFVVSIRSYVPLLISSLFCLKNHYDLVEDSYLYLSFIEKPDYEHIVHLQNQGYLFQLINTRISNGKIDSEAMIQFQKAFFYFFFLHFPLFFPLFFSC